MNIQTRSLQDTESLIKRLTTMGTEEAKKSAVIISEKLYFQIKKENIGEVGIGYELEVGGDYASNQIETFRIKNISIALATVTGQKKFPFYEVVYIVENNNKKRFGTISREEITCYL